MYQIIGLGNPGEQYEHTRHNVGRLLVREIAAVSGDGAWRRDGNAQAFRANGVLDSTPVAFALPETFMNRSGETVSYLAKKEGMAAAECIVVYDDIDLPMGTMRIATNRGHGGHNGIKSIASALGSKEFIRVRIGIAPTSFWTGAVKRPAGGGALERYVLGRLSRSDRKAIAALEPTVRAALTTIVTEGAERAMNTYN